MQLEDILVQTIKKILIVSFFCIIFIACSSKNSIYTLKNNLLVLGIDQKLKVTLNLINSSYQKHTHSCVNNSYTILDKNLEYGNLFIEFISLENSCNWTGLPSSFFQTNLKYQLKLKDMRIVEEYDMDGFNFKTFLINNDSYLNMIYIYTSDKNIFILDSYGRLYDKLLKKFKPDYKNKYLAKKRFLNEYNDSLVKKNLINHYFERERIFIQPVIGISISL